MIITAVLELSTNQVTHFYSDKNNTTEIIKLLDLLLAQNRHLSRLYLSWDAASWHMSKQLMRRIVSNNVMAEVTGSTRVETAPLPAGAQFLNVVEEGMLTADLPADLADRTDIVVFDVSNPNVSGARKSRKRRTAKHAKQSGSSA